MNATTPADLNHPIWAALTTKQAHLGQGNALARRFHPDVAPFAALASATPAAYRALHQLLLPHEQVVLQSMESLNPPDNALHMTPLGMIHQMIAPYSETESSDEQDVVQLGDADTHDMLALVQKTRP